MLSAFTLILRPHKINGQQTSVTFEYFENERGFELTMVNQNSKTAFKINTVKNML